MRKVKNNPSISESADRILKGNDIIALLEATKKIKPEIKFGPKTLALGLLAFGSGLALWDKVEKLLTGLAVKFMRSTEYRTIIDRHLYEVIDRVGSVLRPKVYPIIGELQEEYRRGDYAQVKPGQFEDILRRKIAAKIGPASQDVDAAFAEFSRSVKLLILSNVIEDLIDLIYKEAFHG